MGDIDFVAIAIIFGVILLSMTLHEAMHGFVAYWLGDDTAKKEGRLTLNPLKHLDPFMSLILPLLLYLAGLPIFGGAKPVPFRPDRVKGEEWGAALVAIGGPLTNLIIAFVSYGIWTMVGTPTDGAVGMIFTYLVYVNLGFFVFNILPIPPLDGSRVIYALAPDFVRTGMRFIEQYGIILVFILVLVAGSLLGTYMSAMIDWILAGFNAIFF